MAPEVLDCPFKNKPEENKEKEELYYSLTVDSWAMGVLTYELLVGVPPFNDKQRAAIEDKIRTEQPRFPSSMSELSRSFVLRALQKDPVERPTALELLNHPWIKALKRGAPAAPAHRSLGATSAAAPIKSALKPAVSVSAPEEDNGDSSVGASSVGAGSVGTTSSPMPTESKLFSKGSVEMRTDDGDLIKAMPSYLSFTAGSNRPKLPMLSKDKGKLSGPAAGSAGSFSTANNPKLQTLRGLS